MHKVTSGGTCQVQVQQRGSLYVHRPYLLVTYFNCFSISMLFTANTENIYHSIYLSLSITVHMF